MEGTHLVRQKQTRIFLIALTGSIAFTTLAACSSGSDGPSEGEGLGEGAAEGEGEGSMEGEAEGDGEGGEGSGGEGEGGTFGCGTPLECRSDEDCPRVARIFPNIYKNPEPLHCDLADCRCKQCLSNEDCSHGHFCTLAWDWACDNRSTCTSEADCLASDQPLVYMACLDGYCQVCKEDADCRPGERCVNGIEIMPGAVLTDGHCIPAEAEGSGSGGTDAGVERE